MSDNGPSAGSVAFLLLLVFLTSVTLGLYIATHRPDPKPIASRCEDRDTR